MNMHKGFRTFLVVVKNLLAFLAGALVGGLATLLYARQLLEHAITKDVGLGIIAVAPVVIIIYAVLFGTVGGVMGIIVYNLFGRRRVRP